MNATIFNPAEEYNSKFKNLHSEKTQGYFENLVQQSGVDIEANRRTVKQYLEQKENARKLKNSILLWKILRIVMIVTLILIPLVIWKITPIIRALRAEISEADKKAIFDCFVTAYEGLEKLRCLNQKFLQNISLVNQ